MVGNVAAGEQNWVLGGTVMKVMEECYLSSLLERPFVL